MPVRAQRIGRPRVQLLGDRRLRGRARVDRALRDQPLIVAPGLSSSSHGSMSRTTTISCETRRVLRAAYLDLDGTLLGRGASLFHDADGGFTLLGARALEACARADVEVVPYSGRRQSTLLHDARLLGLRSLHLRGGLRARARRRARVAHRRPRAPRRQDDPRADRGVGRAGAAARALCGPARVYEPWRHGREVSQLFLGDDIDACEADALLIEHGHGHLRLSTTGSCTGGRGTAAPTT